ncbi:MAG TPA: hypothetical protein VGZ90_19050 [Puia sp.]|nr:hypothetical protein [Puia sp.]
MQRATYGSQFIATPEGNSCIEAFHSIVQREELAAIAVRQF